VGHRLLRHHKGPPIEANPPSRHRRSRPVLPKEFRLTRGRGSSPRLRRQGAPDASADALDGRFDEIGHRFRSRDVDRVAAGDFDGRGVGSLGHGPLCIGGDHPILGRN
jgi:hypothetical protein